MGKGISRNLPKKGGGVKYFKDKMEVKQKGGIQEKGEQMPDFFYCFEYKSDIATLKSFSYSKPEIL